MDPQIARYPPLPKAEDVGRGVGTFGVGPHSDSGFLSLLLQDDVGGARGTTSPHFRPGLFVVNRRAQV